MSGLKILPRVIAGFGHPERKGTLHNVGSDFLTFLVNALSKNETPCAVFPKSTVIKVRKREYLLPDPINVRNDPFDIALVQINSLMNVGHRDVIETLRRLNNHAPSNLLCVHPCMDSKLGDFCFTTGGADRGDSDVPSMLDTKDAPFNRIRIGVGCPTKKDNVYPFALTPVESEVSAVFDNTFKEIFDILNIQMA